MKKILRIVIILLVVLALAALIVKRKKQAAAAPAYGERPVAVHVAVATQRPLEKAHSYLGVAEAWQTAAVSSRIAARVETVPTDEGDRVKAGDVLLQLDDSDVQAQLNAAEASIQSLETNHSFWADENRRDSKLAEEGVISKVEAEATRNRLADASARLDAAQRGRDILLTQLTYTKLVSPFDGMITKRDVDPGTLATPGKPLMVVEDRSKLKLAFDAPQEDMAFMKEGLPVRAQAGEKELKLVVTHMYPSLDRARMARIEVEAPVDAGLQVGALVPLSVVLARHENAVTVPRECLMENTEGQTTVFVLKDGVLEARPVKTLMASGGRVEVQGLEAGEQVVTSTFLGWATLSSGLKVEVVR